MWHYVYIEFAIALFDGSVMYGLTIIVVKPDTLPKRRNDASLKPHLLMTICFFKVGTLVLWAVLYPPCHTPGDSKHGYPITQGP